MLALTRTKIVAALAVAALVASTGRADTLKWKFKEGDKMNYAMSQTNNILVDAGGVEFDAMFSMIFDLTWEVKSVAGDGTAEVAQTIDRVQMHVSTPFTGEFHYDSKEGTSPEGPIWEQMGPTIESMVGEAFLVKVAANGEVEQVTLPEKLQEQFAGQRRGGGGAAALLGGAGSFNEDSIKQVIKQTVVSLPAGDVSSGTKWTKSYENSLGPIGVEKYETTYSFESVESRDGKDLHKIVTVTELTFEVNENSDLDVFMELTEQEGSGTVLFDAAAGRAVESKFTQKSVMEGDFMGNEFAQERETVTRIILGSSDDLKE